MAPSVCVPAAAASARLARDSLTMSATTVPAGPSLAPAALCNKVCNIVYRLSTMVIRRGGGATWTGTWPSSMVWPMAYDAPCGGSGRYARPA
eukprot:4623819-Prymnesium_polylepis.1